MAAVILQELESGTKGMKILDFGVEHEGLGLRCLSERLSLA